MVNGPSPGPEPAAQARDSSSGLTRIQLADVALPEAAQEGPQGGSCLDCAADGASCSAGTQHVGVVDAVAASQRRCHERHHLVAGVGSACCMAQVQVPVNQLGQAKVQGQGVRKNQPGIC